MPSAVEIAYVMMLVGYVVTIITAYRLLFAALVWALTQLSTIVNQLMEQYAPKWLRQVNLQLEAWLTLPAWISWKLDDLAVTALERATAKYRAVNDRKRSQLLEEAENYNQRYYDVMSK